MTRIKKKAVGDRGEYNAGSGAASTKSMDRQKYAAAKFIGENCKGSGSLVTFNRWPLFFTNNHVCGTKGEASVATLEFEDNEDNIIQAKLEPNFYFLTHSDLDFTLVAMKRHPRMKNGKLFKPAWDVTRMLKMKIPKVMPGDLVSLNQHPEGGDKHISTGAVIKVSSGSISYEADTFPGTSGSLVTMVGDVVGIHVGRLAGKRGNYCTKI